MTLFRLTAENRPIVCSFFGHISEPGRMFLPLSGESDLFLSTESVICELKPSLAFVAGLFLRIIV